MTIEEQLREMQDAGCPNAAPEGFEAQRALVDELRATGLLREPAPPAVPDTRPPVGPVKVRWRVV